MKNSPRSDASTDLPLSTRKVVERALILPLIGLLLLLPPIAGIFEIDTRLFGIPFTVLYLFVLWALLILAAARLAPGLLNVDERTEHPEKPEKVNSGTEL